MMKRSMVVGGALVLAVSIAGCGGEDSPEATATTTVAETTQAAGMTTATTTTTTTASSAGAKNYGSPLALGVALTAAGVPCKSFAPRARVGSVQSATCQITARDGIPVQVTLNVFDGSVTASRYVQMTESMPFYAFVEGADWMVDCSMPGGRGNQACEDTQDAIGGMLHLG